MITKDILLQIAPAASKSKLNLDDLATALNKLFNDPNNGFSNSNRRAAFLAQCIHESGSFCHVAENLNYSAEGLVKIFHKYFPDLEHATPYARNPEKIANKVYASRMGNGDEHTGQGYKFRGRGFIQLTGFSNYQNCGHDIGKDLINYPEYLETAEGALASANWFFKKNNLLPLADTDDILHMTKKINGGTIGLDERTHLYQKAKQVLGA